MLSNRRQMSRIVKFLIGMGIVLQVIAQLVGDGTVTLRDLFGPQYVILIRHSITPAIVSAVAIIVGYMLIIEGLLAYIYPAPHTPKASKVHKPITRAMAKRYLKYGTRVIIVLIGIVNIYEYAVGVYPTSAIPIGGVSIALGLSLDKLIHISASMLGLGRTTTILK